MFLNESLFLDTQLFRQKLSHISVKANATMSISVMGSDSLVSLIEVNSVSQRKSITRVCVVSFSYDEIPSASIKQPLVNITYNTF